MKSILNFSVSLANFLVTKIDLDVSPKFATKCRLASGAGIFLKARGANTVFLFPPWPGTVTLKFAQFSTGGTERNRGDFVKTVLAHLVKPF